MTMGAAPGSLILVGRQKMDKPVYQFMQYDSERMEEAECKTIEEAIEKIEKEKITWINIYGIHDMEMIQKIGNALNLPALHLEEILNTDQRPKFEESENFNSFILKYLYDNPELEEIRADQVSIIFGENFVLTLQERKAGFLEPVRQRLRNNKTPIRKGEAIILPTRFLIPLSTPIRNSLRVSAAGLKRWKIGYSGRQMLQLPKRYTGLKPISISSESR